MVASEVAPLLSAAPSEEGSTAPSHAPEDSPPAYDASVETSSLLSNPVDSVPAAAVDPTNPSEAASEHSAPSAPSPPAPLPSLSSDAPAPTPRDPEVLAAVSRAGGTAPPAFDFIAPDPPEDPEDAPGYHLPDITHLTAAQRTALGFPLQAWVRPERRWGRFFVYIEKIHEQFYSSLMADNQEVVAMMVNSGIVSPDVTVKDGYSALGLAAREGHFGLAQLLISLGAGVDKVFELPHPRDAAHLSRRKGEVRPTRTRTALLIAAETGRLPLVKYLMSLGADDGFVPSDGHIALRLAATNGHRDVVDFLPARRAGALRRFRTYNEEAFRRMRNAATALYNVARIFLWSLPKYFVWDIPVAVAKQLFRPIKWAWKNRASFPGWCYRCIVEPIVRMLRKIPKASAAAGRGMARAPGAVYRFTKEYVPKATKAIWRGTKATAVAGQKAAVATKNAAVATPGAVCRWTKKYVPRASRAVWRATKATATATKKAAVATPGVIKRVAVWWGKRIAVAAVAMWQWLKKTVIRIVAALGAVLGALLSMLHTAFLALQALVRRIGNVKFADVVAAAGAVVRAVGGIAAAIWKGLKALNDLVYTVLTKVALVPGWIIYHLVKGVIALAMWVPYQLGVIATAAASMVAKAGREIMVLINPKH